MSKLTRFGMCLDSDLLKTFDQHLDRKGYQNRSEALRDLIRNAIVQEQWIDQQEIVVGIITLVYDLNRLELLESMTAIQHEYQDLILSSMSVYLDTDHSLQVIALKGRTESLKNLSDNLIALKGVIHGQLTLSTTGVNIK
ncbi:nickel-responsive transcriptional regulator NikR [candidate division KSB1 bacterium]|jgi:CopG family nickel-responsive transcriptional regulator|nr:nickel-responsive transcriptional regulator NikR [candidate division KSB1 bacterium]